MSARAATVTIPALLALAAAAPAATTADTLALWLDPKPAPAFADLEAGAGADAAGDTRGGPGRESLAWYHTGADTLVAGGATSAHGHADLSGSITADRLDLRGDGRFPDGGALPGRLDAVGVNLCARLLPGDGRVFGVSFTGRASGPGPGAGDAGLFAARHVDGELDAFARLSRDPHAAWVLSASYATDPTWFARAPLLPGAGYLYTPDDRLWALIGFPITYVVWRPRPWFSAEGGFIDNLHAGADLHPSAAWSLGLAYDWTADDWRAGRSRRDLVVLDAMRATATAGWTPRPWCEVDLAAGMAFARTLSRGDEAARRDDVRHLGSAPTVALAVYLSE
jgi:hypothetical protein